MILILCSDETTNYLGCMLLGMIESACKEMMYIVWRCYAACATKSLPFLEWTPAAMGAYALTDDHRSLLALLCCVGI
jgi:hypothetical protein